MTQALTPWYNAERVATKGSVILTEWRKAKGPEYRKHQARSMEKRGYAGASFGRTVADWVAQSTSADSELYTSLRSLRNRSRQLVRDNEYAGNAIDRIIPNNVVGQGIGFQSQVMMRRGGKLNDAVNDLIEKKWSRWTRAKFCDVAGKRSLQDMERMIMRNVPESGEMLVRMVFQKFGGSEVPLALELIEADQLVENYSGRTNDGNEVRMGVEVDQWQRPVAYWLYPRHPGDYSFSGTPASNTWQRVPAGEILHIALFDRPLQTRGVPWLHNVLVKLRHMGGYEEAEIVRARASASIMGFIESPEVDNPISVADWVAQSTSDAMNADDVEDGEKVFDMSPGIIKELGPGEKFSGFAPTSANAALEPFMRFMLRSVAAGSGISYESISRDYSQSNYSSSRLALTEDRDNWRILQAWFIRQFHEQVFEKWLDLAVLSGTLNLPGYEQAPEVYQAVKWRPRGWDWIDPMKEVSADRLAIRSGMKTLTDVLAAKGSDIEEAMKTRRRELDMAAEYDLVFDTDPAQVDDKGVAQATPPAQETDTGASDNGTPLAGDDETNPAAGDDSETDPKE